MTAAVRSVVRYCAAVLVVVCCVVVVDVAVSVGGMFRFVTALVVAVAGVSFLSKEL